VDDASLRRLGASGEVVVQPGSLDWFRVAAQSRAASEGLRVRLVPEARGRGGWDPASAYRTLRQTVAQMAATAEGDGRAAGQAGETRPEGAGPAG
jgi:hypothetical protein